MFCPKCGTKNNPKSHFCKNCGFDLTKYKQENQPNRQMPLRHQATSMNYRSQPQSMMPMQHRRHHGWMICTVVLLAIIVGGGVYTYSHNIFPFGNHSFSSESMTPQNTGTQVIKGMWQKVNNKMGSDTNNNGSTDLTSDFKGGTGSKNYNKINKWADQVNAGDANNNTQVASITPYDFVNQGNGNYVYDVKYDFKINSGSSHHHIQVFKWRTSVKNGKITSMNSPKTPVTQYDSKSGASDHSISTHHESSNANKPGYTLSEFPSNIQGTWYSYDNGKLDTLTIKGKSFQESGMDQPVTIHTRPKNADGSKVSKHKSWAIILPAHLRGLHFSEVLGWNQTAGDGESFAEFNHNGMTVLDDGGGAEFWTDANFFRTKAQAKQFKKTIFKGDGEKGYPKLS